MYSWQDDGGQHPEVATLLRVVLQRTLALRPDFIPSFHVEGDLGA